MRTWLSMTFSALGVFFLFSSVNAATVDLVKARVLFEGAPVEGMAVTWETDDVQMDYATSNALGYVNFYYKDEGSHKLIFDPQMSYDCSVCGLFEDKEVSINVDADSAVFDSAISSTVQDLGDYSLEQASRFVRVHVVDQDGADVVGVPVNANENTFEYDPENPPGYAYGTTDSNGEFSFAVRDDSDGKWFFSVDPQWAADESVRGHTAAWVNDVEVEDDGETAVEIEVQETDGTIEISLVNQDGDTFTVPEMGYTSINCYEPFDPAKDGGKDGGFNSLFFFGNLNEGESTASISVLGGRDYTCDGWTEEGAVIGTTATVPENGTVSMTFTVLESDSQITVRFVDENGAVIKDIEGAVDAFSVENADGEEYWGAFSYSDVTDGKATLDVISGFTYSVGGFLFESGSGGNSVPVGGDDGSEGGDKPLEGGTGDGFDGLSVQLTTTGISAASTDGTQYIQNYERYEVVPSASQIKKVSLPVEQADATITVQVNRVDKTAAAYAWVDGMEADSANSRGESLDGEKGNRWGRFIGGMTDENGEVELAVKAGTYEIGAYTENSYSQDVLSPARQTVTVKKDGNKKVTLQEVAADWTINITATTSDGEPLDFVNCSAFDPEGGFENFGDIGSGEGSIAFAANATAYVDCMGYSATTFYRAGEQVVETDGTSGGSSSVEVILSEAGDFYDEVATTVSATTTATITLSDGRSKLTMPANCLADSGNITVTTGTYQNGTSQTDDAHIINEAPMNYTFTDDTGAEISAVSDSCTSGLTLVTPYDEEDVDDETILTGLGHYNEDTKRWGTPATTQVDTGANKITSTIKTFSPFGILQDGQRSSSTLKKPGKLKQKRLKIKKRKKKSVLMKWSAKAGADWYNVRTQKRKPLYKTIAKKKNRWNKKKTYKRITNLKKRATRLKPGSTYRFRVRACNDSGCGKWSPNKAFTTKKAS